MTEPPSDQVQVAQEILGVVSHLRAEEMEALGEAILRARRVFVCGAGRSLLVLKAFAMRLMHLGLQSYVVGDVVTPAIEEGDLLLAGSNSGRTRTTLAIVEAASVRGAQTAALTAHPESALGRGADLRLEIPVRLVGVSDPAISAQPPGSLFEQSLLVTCDGLVLWLMRRLGTSYEDMRARHTKLE